MQVLRNLKKRKIVQWALAYLASAWLVVQVVDVLGGRWGLDDSVARLLDLALFAGFFIVLVVAWYHGEQGRQKVSGTELTIIAAILGLGGIGISLVDVSGASATAEQESAKRAVLQPGEIESAPWIAVTRFDSPPGNAGLATLASGLASGITDGLARFSHLLVLSRATTESVAGSMADSRDLGTELGARYVVEGDLQQAGSAVRLRARLVDALDGTTVWTERFDEDLASADAFALQDRLTGRIVASIASVPGAVTRALSAPIVDKAPEAMTPYEAILQFSLNRQSVGADEHLRSRIALERAVETEPGYADAWACLSHVYMEEYISAYNTLPGSMDRALAAVQRAVELDATSALAHYSLAAIQYFRQDLGAFRAAMDRALDLNPYDAQALAMLGILLGYARDWERSVTLTARAIELHPDHPGYYLFNHFFNEYRQENYTAALAIAQRINLPGYWGDGLARTLAHGQLGNEEAARAAAADLLGIWPTFERDYGELGLKNWMFAQPELADHIIEGLEKAGLDMHWESQGATGTAQRDGG